MAKNRYLAVKNVSKYNCWFMETIKKNLILDYIFGLFENWTLDCKTMY